MGKIWLWDNITVNNTFNIFQVCSSIYRICSDIKWGKYDYGTILQLIIQLIYFKSVAVYTGYVVTEYEGNMNMGQYYS